MVGANRLESRLYLFFPLIMYECFCVAFVTENISRLVVRGTQAGKVRSKNGLQVTMTRAFLVDLFFHNYRYLKILPHFKFTH